MARTAPKVGRPRKPGTCAKHRARQNRYVAKNPDKQRRRVAEHYKDNAASIKADKKRARRQDKGGGGGSRKVGRPREC